MKSYIYYFKKTFVFVFGIVFVFYFLNGMFELDFSSQALLKTFFESFMAAFVTGILCGIINMKWLKRENFFLPEKKIEKQ